MLWSLKNYFQLCTWKEKASLTFINHLLCSPAHSQVLYTCNSTQSSKQHMRDGAVWPENTGLKLLSNLPKFILLHKSHTSICFFFHTTWASGNASIQVQNLRHVSHVSQGMCLDAAREEIMALFGFSKLHMYCDRYCSVVWSLNENVSHKFIYLKMGFRVRDTIWAGLGGMALIEEICLGTGFEVTKQHAIPNLISVSFLWFSRSALSYHLQSLHHRRPLSHWTVIPNKFFIL